MARRLFVDARRGLSGKAASRVMCVCVPTCPTCAAFATSRPCKIHVSQKARPSYCHLHSTSKNSGGVGV